ncbi:MAG: DUF3316 domain-containing protein [Dysgonamonadaceae bacterium]|jgi:hypothetical protein|nr:DUF3316 domain-containing protein [Dysgonamonadaceae bacterium]
MVMRRSVLFLLFLISVRFLSAQEEQPVNLIYQSVMMGVGKTSVYDTYLSPLNYDGNSFGMMLEQSKMTGIMNGKVAVQHLLNLDFSHSHNDTETASDYAGFIEYSYGLLYKFTPLKRTSLFAGMQANGMLGFIYNSRNGNNPATGKVHLNANLSAIVAHTVSIKSQPFRLRFQTSIPVAGILFSPHYGQSYYEISLGDSDGLIDFASLHNHLSMRNLLSVEIPFNALTLRLAYRNNIYETDVNALQTRVHSNSFYIGFSKNFFSVPEKKIPKDNYKRVFE